MLEKGPFGLAVEVECLCQDWHSDHCTCSGLRWRFIRFRRYGYSVGMWREMNDYHRVIGPSDGFDEWPEDAP